MKQWFRSAWGSGAPVLVTFALLLPATTRAQIPDKFTNLQFFPADISRAELIGNMREFSFALGVRCQYCHAGGDGVSFDGVAFQSDDDPDKAKARYMLRMTRNLNATALAGLPERDTPQVTIGCKTCHRGQPKPLLLRQEMRLALDQNGRGSAVARYRELREEFLTAGAFDFGEWEVNTLAEELHREGMEQDAIAVYQLNSEFHPDSVSIYTSLGALYESTGDAAAAIRAYRRVLELRPDHERAKERLAALEPN